MEEMKLDEGRADFYDEAIELLNAKPEPYLIQASLILLAIWNKSGFNYITDKEKTLKALKSAFKETKDALKAVEGITIKEADFKDTDLCRNIERIYDAFSSIKGIQYTGASKVMHLCNRELFVMWDAYISGNSRKKWYRECDIDYHHYKRDAKGYLEFLKEQQERIKDVSWGNRKRTLAKAIDEYNYINITEPIQRKFIKSKEK